VKDAWNSFDESVSSLGPPCTVTKCLVIYASVYVSVYDVHNGLTSRAWTLMSVSDMRLQVLVSCSVAYLEFLLTILLVLVEQCVCVYVCVFVSCFWAIT